MRIAFFTDVYHPVISGLIENIETCARALREAGHEVIIVAPKSPRYKSSDPNVFLIPSLRYNKNPELRFIIPLPSRGMTRLLAMDLDIIHGHAGGPACFLGWEIARRKKIPYVYTHHTRMQLYTHYVFNGKLINPRATKLSLRILSNLSSRVIAPTKAIKKELKSWGVKKPIEVIAGGLDLQKFQPQGKGFLRSRYNISEDQVILLYVGRIGTEKSIDFIIKAFAKVSEKDSNCSLFIVGDGPEKSNLQKLTTKLGLDKKVIFTGFIPMDQVPKVYADGDIFVFSSKTETQGLVLYEAMSQGLPVVAVRDGAFEGVIINGENGYQTSGVVKDFANTIVKLVQNQTLRKKLGKAGQSLVQKEYSSLGQAQELVKLYETAIKETEDHDQTNKILKQSATKLIDFLKMNERLNRFKELVKIPR